MRCLLFIKESRILEDSKKLEVDDFVEPQQQQKSFLNTFLKLKDKERVTFKLKQKSWPEFFKLLQNKKILTSKNLIFFLETFQTKNFQYTFIFYCLINRFSKYSLINEFTHPIQKNAHTIIVVPQELENLLFLFLARIFSSLYLIKICRQGPAHLTFCGQAFCI